MEAWEDHKTSVRFYFSHTDASFTTGVMVIPPKTELPKHNRPLAVENLVQVNGKCVMKLFNDDDVAEYELAVGDYLVIPKGQFHTHSNPFDMPSHTLFKAEGDITAIVATLKQTFTRVELAKK